MDAMLDLLDESPRSLVVPRASPGPRGATGVPAARSGRSRGRPGLPEQLLKTYTPDPGWPRVPSQIHGKSRIF